jgi:hypothetical protein
MGAMGMMRMGGVEYLSYVDMEMSRKDMEWNDGLNIRVYCRLMLQYRPVQVSDDSSEGRVPDRTQVSMHSRLFPNWKRGNLDATVVSGYHSHHPFGHLSIHPSSEVPA